MTFVRLGVPSAGEALRSLHETLQLSSVAVVEGHLSNTRWRVYSWSASRSPIRCWSPCLKRSSVPGSDGIVLGSFGPVQSVRSSTCLRLWILRGRSGGGFRCSLEPASQWPLRGSRRRCWRLPSGWRLRARPVSPAARSNALSVALPVVVPRRVALSLRRCPEVLDLGSAPWSSWVLLPTCDRLFGRGPRLASLEHSALRRSSLGQVFLVLALDWATVSIAVSRWRARGA